MRAPTTLPERPALFIGDRRVALDIRIDGRARAIAIRLPPPGDRVRLTLPSRRQLAAGLAFVESRTAWIEARIGRSAGRPFLPGLEVPWGGERLVLAAGAGRLARREGSRLVAGGDPALFAGRVRRWLLADARDRLEGETRELAARLGKSVAAVRVADPVSRWGSCGRDGRISYSWRLLLAPGFVRRSVVAHEVAHLAEPHHQPSFWRLAADLLGGSHAPAQEWLRAEGPGLHLWGRD